MEKTVALYATPHALQIRGCNLWFACSHWLCQVVFPDFCSSQKWLSINHYWTCCSERLHCTRSVKSKTINQHKLCRTRGKTFGGSGLLVAWTAAIDSARNSRHNLTHWAFEPKWFRDRRAACLQHDWPCVSVVSMLSATTHLHDRWQWCRQPPQWLNPAMPTWHPCFTQGQAAEHQLQAKWQLPILFSRPNYLSRKWWGPVAPHELTLCPETLRTGMLQRTKTTELECSGTFMITQLVRAKSWESCPARSVTVICWKLWASTQRSNTLQLGLFQTSDNIIGSDPRSIAQSHGPLPRLNCQSYWPEHWTAFGPSLPVHAELIRASQRNTAAVHVATAASSATSTSAA